MNLRHIKKRKEITDIANLKGIERIKKLKLVGITPLIPNFTFPSGYTCLDYAKKELGIKSITYETKFFNELLSGKTNLNEIQELEKNSLLVYYINSSLKNNTYHDFYDPHFAITKNNSLNVISKWGPQGHVYSQKEIWQIPHDMGNSVKIFKFNQ